MGIEVSGLAFSVSNIPPISMGGGPIFIKNFSQFL
jgi:hypothetical protein